MPDRSSDPAACASILKLLAEETRMGIVEQLLDGPRHVGEINAELDIDQSLLSHHLRVLRDGGLIESERDGKAVLYRLAPHVLARRAGRALDLGCCRLSFKERGR
jgi:ArsR family transcriptional regulator